MKTLFKFVQNNDNYGCFSFYICEFFCMFNKMINGIQLQSMF